MAILPIENTVSNKAEYVTLSTQIAMNIVAGNAKDHINLVKKGLIYTDFICADNLLILLHGKVMTCFDLMNKSGNI